MMRKRSSVPRNLPYESPQLAASRTTDINTYHGVPITSVNTVMAGMRPDSERTQNLEDLQGDGTSTVASDRHRAPQRRVVSTRDRQMKLLDQLLGPNTTSTTHQQQGGPLLPTGYPLVYGIPPRSQSAAPSSVHNGYHGDINTFAPMIPPPQQMSPLRLPPSQLIRHAHALHNGYMEPAYPAPVPTHQVSSSDLISDQVRQSPLHFGSSAQHQSARSVSQLMPEPTFQSSGGDTVTTPPDHKSTLLSLLMGK